MSEIKGEKINCMEVDIDFIIHNVKSSKLYPYVITNSQTKLSCIRPSPLHGRSIVVDFNPTLDRFTITKGNGLTYFPFGFISTHELEDHAWGYLRTEDAIRDFKSGEYIKNLGILTNIMEALFLLKEQIIRLPDGVSKIQPTILQYSVICPYRIADIPFLSKELVYYFIKRWPDLFDINYSELHCNAAEVLLKNIHLLHKSDVLHNAIHAQNYSLSLELLDFELARTPSTPYKNEYEEQTYIKLQKREVIQSLEIVNQIAFYFNEKINSKILREIMIKNGFEKYLYPS
jgi:hypothetical protein